MAQNEDQMEQHGCIVCGKVYNLLVVYTPDGQLVDWTVTSPGGRRVPDTKPLVACEKHTEAEIKTALERHYPGHDIENLEDD